MAGTGKRTSRLRAVRRGLLRIARPITRKRHGYVYVWRRAIAGRLDERAWERRRDKGLDLLTLDDLPARVPGATYREIEPVAPDVAPPPGWVAPKHHVDDGRVEAGAAPARLVGRGHGVVEIPGGVVFGASGIYGPYPDGLLVDANAMWPADEHELLEIADRARARDIETLDGVTMSVMAHNDNYCHWLLQGLPRLEILRRGFGLEADRIMVRGVSARTVDALERLGVRRDRMMFPQHGSPMYRCETLRAATGPQFHELGDDWVVEFLHQLYLPDPPRGSRRLYVQRGVANRSVMNESEVLELLLPAGFEAVSMEGRTISEQAALFASAEAVVSTHGAALSNLAFCRPGTQVVELAGSNTARTGFARLCWRRGMHHEFVVGTEPCAPGRWWTWLIDAETSVDVPELRRTLGRLDLL